MNLIELDDIEKTVATKAGRTWLLRRIQLNIAEGEFVTIMGPSGAGKSITVCPSTPRNPACFVTSPTVS